MIDSLELFNFRCFEHHEVPFRPVTIMVGKNNAGKSTIIDALRLVAHATKRYQTTNFSDVPKWLDIPKRNHGIRPSMRGMEINLNTVFHRYGNPPATVKARFNTGQSVNVYIGPDSEVFAVVLDVKGQPIVSKSQARDFLLPPVEILPQVGPLQREERVLDPDYVRRAMSSDLAPLHFRNELNLFPEARQAFSELAAATWHGFHVNELRTETLDSETFLSLFVRDGGFVAEVAWMGHGLQMWLQAMWFLARTSEDAVVILDEPDVYMHADLQRRLVRLIRPRFRQSIIATHSIEIMAEVEPEQILVVDRRRVTSRFAASLPAVQNVIERFGSIHNIQLTRLWSAKKCLLVEGKDLDLLIRFQRTLFPLSEEPFDTIPHMSIGGWGGWNYAIGSSMLLKNSGGQTISVYCIFDSDYHTEQDISGRKSLALKREVRFQIWRRKEIENFLLNPEVLHRIIAFEISSGKPAPKVETVVAALDVAAQELRDQCTDAISEELWKSKAADGPAKANKMARTIVADSWKTLEQRLSIVSGKAVLSKIFEWSQKSFGVSLSAVKIATLMQPSEIPEEMTMVIKGIEHNTPFMKSLSSTFLAS
jgi:energy-coupling factor transporter ATP-binding protein EcfA2